MSGASAERAAMFDCFCQIGDLKITGFCVAVAQHFANLTGQQLGGIVAILCEVTHGKAPTRAAILKMTKHVKPFKGRTKVVC